jgi:NTP pyrophosphatase (non-canonical NTP hydrolase)
MSEIEEITAALVRFRNERDWEQFHNPKDLAVALSIEASELLELFLWKSPDEADREKVKEELADVLAYSLMLAAKYDFDVRQIILDKVDKNVAKYPVDKSKGSMKKYNEL